MRAQWVCTILLEGGIILIKKINGGFVGGELRNSPPTGMRKEVKTKKGIFEKKKKMKNEIGKGLL